MAEEGNAAANGRVNSFAQCSVHPSHPNLPASWSNKLEEETILQDINPVNHHWNLCSGVLNAFFNQTSLIWTSCLQFLPQIKFVIRCKICLSFIRRSPKQVEIVHQLQVSFNLFKDYYKVAAQLLTKLNQVRSQKSWNMSAAYFSYSGVDFFHKMTNIHNPLNDSLKEMVI